MRTGTLGDSTDDEYTRITRSSYASLSSPRNQRERAPTTSKKAREVERSKNTRSESTRQQEPSKVVGAARRKQKTFKQRQLADLRKIIALQKSTRLQIPKAPFARVVREITLEMADTVTHYTPTALEALHEATEMFITQVFQDAYMLTLHRKCVTLSLSDMVLLRALKLNM